jgi:hypothetical protein
MTIVVVAFPMFLNALETLPGQVMSNRRLGNSTLPCEWSPLNGRVGYAARRVNGKDAPGEVNGHHCFLYKKGVCCVAFFTLILAKFLQLIFLCLSSSSSAKMVDHSDSESNNSFSDDAEFDEKVKEIVLGFSDGAPRIHGRGEGTFVCPFCRGKKVPTWSLRELLQHEWEVSQRCGDLWARA